MKTKTIKQTVTFPTTPDKLYALLLDSKKLTKMHDAKATMSKRPKGKFTVFDGYCHGYNMELIEGQKIEQAWVFQEDGWPVFIHKGVPEHKYESIKRGWRTYYWDPLLQQLLKVT